MAFKLQLLKSSKIINVCMTDLTIDDFLQKYGHLRPGTYDINSKRVMKTLNTI